MTFTPPTTDYEARGRASFYREGEAWMRTGDGEKQVATMMTVRDSGIEGQE